MKLLLDVYTSLIFRLSFALPVSFVYRKYSVRVKRKFFWGSASGTGKDEKNGRNEKAERAERNGKAVRAGNVGQLWDWWDRERILNSEFRIGRTGKELFSYSKGSITTLRLSLLIIVIATTHLKAECISRKTR